MLETAVRLADEAGIESLTMRKLAKELGVEAMSLYNHVENKDDILRGIVDAVAAEIEQPQGVDWRAAIRRHAISARDAYLRHRWASSLAMRHGGGPEGLQRSDWLLRTLRQAGFSSDVIYHAYHVLEAYVLGFTTMQLNFPHEREELADMAAAFLQRLPEGEYPDFVEHVHQHIESRDDEEGGFELGLDLILEGLERTRGQEPSRLN